MISEFRNNLDIVLVIAGALLAYHVIRKMRGHPRGIASK